MRLRKYDGQRLKSRKTLSVTVVSGEGGGEAEEVSGVERGRVVERKRRERRFKGRRWWCGWWCWCDGRGLGGR